MRLWFWYRGCGLHVPPTLSPYWAPPTFIIPHAPPRKYLHVRTFVRIFYPRFSSEPLSHAFKVVLEIDFLVGLEDSSAVPLNGPFCAGFLGAWPTRAHLALTGHHAKKHPFFSNQLGPGPNPNQSILFQFSDLPSPCTAKNIDLLRLLYFFFYFQSLKCCFYWMSIQC